MTPPEERMNHARALDKDTTLCISLAARPSNIGTRFHNYLYNELGLNYVYKAFAPADITAAVAGIRGLGIRGAAVSMPYKEDAHPARRRHARLGLGDRLGQHDRQRGRARCTPTTPTIRRSRTCCAATRSPPRTRFAVAGAGGMAKAVVAALRDSGFGSGTVIARNEDAGRALASRVRVGLAADAGRGTGRTAGERDPGRDGGGPQADQLPFPERRRSAPRRSCSTWSRSRRRRR